VDLERGSLSLVSTIEELLGRKSSGSGLETEITAVGFRCADYGAPLFSQKLELTLSTRLWFEPTPPPPPGTRYSI
jgi:hypothetical protein